MQEWVKDLYSTEEGRILLAEEGFCLDVTENICGIMKDKGISNEEMAERLRWRLAFFEDILSGNITMSINQVAKIFFHLGVEVCLGFLPLEEYEK